MKDAEVKRSAIGHEATAEILRTLLNDPDIEMNRISYEQAQDEIALVLKTNSRIPEGTVLNKIEELEKIGYHFAIIKKY